MAKTGRQRTLKLVKPGGSLTARAVSRAGIHVLVRYARERLLYPSLRDLPRPRLRAYRPETVIAEKLHAMVALGAANSRMRDFFDVHALADFAGPVLLSVAGGERFVGIWPPGGPWR